MELKDQKYTLDKCSLPKVQQANILNYDLHKQHDKNARR